MRWWLAGCAGLAIAGAVVAAPQDDKRPTRESYDEVLARLGDGVKENLVIRGEHNSRTDARKHKRFYTDLEPLTEFPPYQPKQQLTGTIRVGGLYLHDGLMKDQWIEAFQRFQPGVKVVITPKGTIASGSVDIETGPRISDRLRAVSQYEQATGQRLFEIDWATGSYDVPGWSPGFVIFVHKDNPIAHLSIQQLDGIFGGARTGGWKGTRWDQTVARGADKNIRTWGQLGLKGEWADKPIHIYGRPLKYNIQLGFERKVLKGGDVWNENTREYSHEMNPDGTRYTSATEIVRDMAADKYGISFSDMASTRPGIRAVPVGATPKGPFVPETRATLRDRTYPLFVEQWAQARQAPGKPLDPLVKEFMTFMLSREGQDAIQKDGKWIVLPAARAAEMRAKLNQPGERIDPREIGLQLGELAPRKWDGEGPDESGTTVAAKAYYTQRFDLGGLPAYAPGAALTGTVRMPASGQLMEGTAGKALLAAFAKYQPGIRFDLKDGDVYDHSADVSIGRRWSTFFAGEAYAFQEKYERSVREFQVATGSYDVQGWSPAFAVYVAKDNPINGLTVRQLDGIFGGPRRGGWVSTVWRRQAGRGADENIRNWGQLGITGACAGKSIQVYVPPLKYHIMSVFERKVLVGGNMWNDDAHEIPLALDRKGNRTQPAVDRVTAAVRTRCGIAFGPVGLNVPGARMVPIAANAASPFVAPTIATVQDRSYPLHLETYAYADQEPGQPLDPKVKEFLRFVLSREGQEIIQRDGKWLPLTPEVAARERAKLDAIIPQVTMK